MKMKSLLIALALLLTFSCALAADSLPGNLTTIDAGAFENADLSGNLTLPAGVDSIGSRAFAGTGLHALIVPDGCATVNASVLAGGEAAYVLINGRNTVISGGSLTDVPYVFGPATSQVSGLNGFYAIESLVKAEGLYFAVTTTEAKPLCAVEDDVLSVCMPKLVNGVPVRSMATLVTNGLENALIEVPEYLAGTTSLEDATYWTMTATAPTTTTTALVSGNTYTFTSAVEGAYGDTTYTWTLTEDGAIRTLTTTEPKLTTTVNAEATLTIALSVKDELGDTASASAEFTFDNPVTYRALLVGNTYPGELSELPGPDNDVYAMGKMLSLYSGTDYKVTKKINVSASTIKSSITSVLGGADANDVSIFYYSGHGTSYGDLCGVGSTYVSVDELREWLDTVPGTKIVLLDCCYSGMHIDKDASGSAFNRAVVNAFSWRSKDNLATDGYIVMTACNKKQTSASLGVRLDDDSVIWFGAFTHALCYGSGYELIEGVTCTAWADASGNNDGKITLGEAYYNVVDTITNIWEVSQATQYFGSTSFVLWSK